MGCPSTKDADRHTCLTLGPFNKIFCRKTSDVATFAGAMACATVCDVVGDEGVSIFGDFGDFLISIAGTGSFGISTRSGLSNEKVLFNAQSTVGFRSGLLPNVKLFTASGFDDNLNDGNFIEFKKMLFEFSVDITIGFDASAKSFGKTLFKRALSGGGS
jgi:hypothetical protein